jgi:CelD/BcsL family acetyltransferase involved in cellulose biosynthesis
MRWTLHDPAELPALERDWTMLAERLGRPLPLDFAMIDCLLAAFGPSGAKICRLADGATVLALAVIERQSALAWRTAKLDNAPLGLWLADPAIDLTATLGALLRALPGLPLLVSLTGLDPALTPRPADGGATRTLDHFATPAITITDRFEPWFATLSKNLRHNLRRQARRLAEAGTAVEIRCLERPDEMADAVERYAELEASGWKSQAGTAVVPGSAQADFYRRLLERFAARGEAQVWQILYDGRVVASDLCLSRAGITVILKTAYNEALVDNHTSPAQLLRRAMFETLFDRPEARGIEFLGPLKQWHKSWTDEQRQLYHLNRYRWAVLPGLKALVERLRAARNPS